MVLLFIFGTYHLINGIVMVAIYYNRAGTT